jgi:hypothetical protein
MQFWAWFSLWYEPNNPIVKAIFAPKTAGNFVLSTFITAFNKPINNPGFERISISVGTVAPSCARVGAAAEEARRSSGAILLDSFVGRLFISFWRNSGRFLKVVSRSLDEVSRRDVRSS